MVAFLNSYMPDARVFVWFLSSFALVFFVRRFFIRRTFLIVTYYTGLACVLFLAMVGAGGVLNDGYKRLDQFIALEQQGQLDYAKNNPSAYDRMFQIDLEQFSNAAAFSHYLQGHEAAADKLMLVVFGFLFAVLAELSLLFVRWLGL